MASTSDNKRYFDEVLATNPKVDKSVVAQYEELERKLHKLGVDTRPRYDLAHPFERVKLNRSGFAHPFERVKLKKP